MISKLHYLVKDDCWDLSDGSIEFGAVSTCRLSKENNLLLNHIDLSKVGFGIFDMLNHKQLEEVMILMKNYLIGKLKKHQTINYDFNLEEYHKHVENDNIHYAIANWALDKNVIGEAYGIIKDKVENILGMPLTLKSIMHQGDQGQFMGFRIVRPNKQDHNPFHRDAWMPYWQDTINIWLPLCGFENDSSLHVVQESHLWDDDEILRTKAGAIIEGKHYHTPQAIASKQIPQISTPLLKKGQGLLFSPFLLHGNAINKNKDTTRISIEIRFCRAN